MIKSISTTTLALIALGFAATGAANAANESKGFHGNSEIPPSTPPGITLINADHLPVSGVARRMWTHLGNDKGEALFYSEQDKDGVSNCSGSCAEEFPPVIALPSAQPAGDWTLFKRADGSQQWVYQGKPLYRFAAESQFNEIVNNLVRAQVRAEDSEGGSFEAFAERDMKRTIGKKAKKLWQPMDFVPETSLTLPESWHLAKFEPKLPKARSPVDLALRDTPNISSVALVNREGRTVYAFDGDVSTVARNCIRGCDGDWLPLLASELSQPVGAFAPLRTVGGDLQWSLQGVPLFTFKGDQKPGDVKGTFKTRALNDISSKSFGKGDGTWYVPVTSQHYIPENVQIATEPVRGETLFTDTGMPLYSRYRTEYFMSNIRAYIKGKTAGIKGCDSECLLTWHPFTAPADAVPQGQWEILMRNDGSRQWAYKGFALYTNINDKPYQRSAGDQIYDPVIGQDSRYKVSEFIEQRYSQTWAKSIAWLWKLAEP